MVFKVLCFFVCLFGVIYLLDVFVRFLFWLRHCKNCPLYEEDLRSCEDHKKGMPCIDILQKYIIGMRAALPDDEGRSEKDEKS